MTIHIQHASSRDATAMARVHEAGFAHPWDESALRMMMEKPGCFALAAYEGSRDLVGFIIARIAADEAEILTIATSPKRRRRGVAGRLMVQAMELAYVRGAQRMFLEVSSKNKPAMSLYGRLGFNEVGRRKAYYQQALATPEDALVMARELTH